MHYSKYILFLGMMILISGCSSNGSINYEKERTYVTSQSEDIFLDTLQYRTFLYFINEINPSYGLVKDRSASWSPASTAAMGFALPIWAIGAEKGWITRKKAVELTNAMINFLLTFPQSTDVFAAGYKGFYYHFLTLDKGKREWKCELSSVDTGWLLAGLLFSRQYYSGNDTDELAVRTGVDSILKRVDWEFFRMKEEGKFQNTINLGWYPEKGFIPEGWRGYNEALILYIIAAGSGMKNIEDGYTKWLDNYDFREPYKGLKLLSFPPLFGHQFSHMFLDFRGLYDGAMIKKGWDYFENSRRATYVQRRYSIENPKGWEGYDSLTWGITACDGPGEQYNKDGKKYLTYAGRGTSGPDLVFFEDGTIAPAAAGGSIPFAPEICIPALMNMKDKYGAMGLWSDYGFKDAFNPTAGWIDSDYIGIDQGPIVLMIENYRTGMIWKYMMKDETIKKGLARLGFRKVEK